MTLETPFAHALALLRGGATAQQIEAALKARGLDAVAVELLVTAARNAHDELVAPAEPVFAPALVPPAQPPTQDVPVGSCARCGAFISTGSQVLVLGTGYCAECSTRPEVSYARAWRDAGWGRRDGWARVMGGFAVLELVGAVMMAMRGAMDRVLMLVAVCAVHLLFFAGVRVARALLVLQCIVVSALSLAERGASAMFTVLLLVLLTWSVLSNVRTMLFFRLEPSEDELKRAYLASASNPPAAWGLGLGLVAVCTAALWGWGRAAAMLTVAVGVLGALVSAAAVWRVDLNAAPPVGMRARGLAGLALSALAALGAIAWLRRA